MNAETPYDVGPYGDIARRQVNRLALAAVVLAACFAWPLLQLASFAWNSEFFSYIPLVPFISGYLVWSNKRLLKLAEIRPCWPGAALGWLAGGAILAGYWIGRHGGWNPERQDYLTAMITALLCFFWGVCLALLGSKLCYQILFPLAFLVFAIPMPTGWEAHIETFFQATSAAAAQGFCHLFREPVLRAGLNLRFTPPVALRVAPECSGIHSTLVLLMTACLADYLFLRRFWTRAALVLFVVPLAILRNGFRVFVIGWLCVHVSPKMIDSPIHHQGGPIFFVLSLVPFFFLLMWLRKLDFPTVKAPINQRKDDT